MIDKIYVLIPVYNESLSIYNLLKKFSDFFNTNNYKHELILINDNSTDDSEKFILKAKDEFPSLSINYIKLTSNKGLQGVLKTGISMINDTGNSNILVTLDGDDTHNPFVINDMLNKIEQGADIVTASRYCEQSRIKGLSFLRKFLSVCSSFLYRVLWNLNGVKDYTCNFRAYRLGVINKLKKQYGEELITEEGFTAVTELLKKAAKLDPVFVEVPMILVYSNKIQPSNMKIFKTIYQNLKILISK